VCINNQGHQFHKHKTMNNISLQKLKQLKFFGMHDALTSAIETGKLDQYTTDHLISHLVESEWDDRYNRKIARAFKNARFRYVAQIENLVYNQDRNLDQNGVLRLAQFNFIKKGQNLLITGSTGVGKSYIASALGHQACIEGYKVLYFNTTKMLAHLKMAKADGSYTTSLSLMILDSKLWTNKTEWRCLKSLRTDTKKEQSFLLHNYPSMNGMI
jgi:DNA replication protein DnaC